MNKLMIVVGMLSGMSLPSTSEIKKDGTRVDIIEKVFLSEAIDNIQDQETWIREDINNGEITKEEAEYYLENLNRTEYLLVELYKINTITKR